MAWWKNIEKTLFFSLDVGSVKDSNEPESKGIIVEQVLAGLSDNYGCQKSPV